MSDDRTRMTDQARSRMTMPSTGLPVLAAAFAIAVFIGDTVTSLEIAVGVLYVAVVLMAARFLHRRGVVLVSAGCVGLVVLSLILTAQYTEDGLINTLVCIAAIGIVTILVLQSQSAEVALHDQANLLSLAHDAILVRELDGTISYWNHGAEELYGWSAEQAVGKIIHDLLKTAFPASLEDIHSDALRVGHWEGDLTQEKRDGTKVIVSSRWALRQSEPGRPVAVLEINTDITERKQAEGALREKDRALEIARTELAHVSRLTTLGELTVSIVHEVSQPLGAMINSAAAGARWLAAEPPAMSEARVALDNIAADGKRAREVIARIRAHTKRQAPRTDLLDLNRRIVEVVSFAEHELRSRDIVLETKLDSKLPQVTGDRVQLQQVLLNLIINAIEAMSAVNDRPRELTIVSRQDDANSVQVEVRDSGTGLDPERAEQVFNAFYTTKAEGIGIGLSISRSIVEAHGGRLWASRNEPHGAVFQLSLPVAAEEGQP